MIGSRNDTRVALAVTLVAVLVGALSSPAFAHARYVGSDPADREKLDSAPSEVSAEYSEPLEPDSHMEVYNPCGQRVDGGDVRVTGYEMAVSMSSDSAGTYVVAWTAASAIDPHVTEGNFTFTVTQGTDCNEPAPNPDGDGSANENTGSNDPSGSETTSSAGPASSGKNTSSGRVIPAENQRKGKHAQHKNMRRGARSPARRTVAQPQDPSPPGATEGPSGLPLSSVLLALGMSVLIGASGGWVYAGLLGPRR